MPIIPARTADPPQPPDGDSARSSATAGSAAAPAGGGSTSGALLAELQYPTDIALLAALWRPRYKHGFREAFDELRRYFRRRRGRSDYIPLAERRRLFASRWRSLRSEMAAA